MNFNNNNYNSRKDKRIKSLIKEYETNEYIPYLNIESDMIDKEIVSELLKYMPKYLRL
jgi:outer membrane receptor for Fe3+-dicitrate